MRSAVTGGAGFIGSHVVDKLVDAGDQVVVLDSYAAPHRTDVEYAEVDVADFESVLFATRGCDYIYHLAAMSNVNDVFQRPVQAVRANLQGTVNVLEAARYNGVKRAFFASTVWVYSGARGDDVCEDSPFYMPGAGHIYTTTKIASELLCHDYDTLYEVPFTVFRYGIPYGPRMREGLVIPIFVRKALAGEPLTIMGDGMQCRNFVYVEDLAEAHVIGQKPEAENQIFNLEGLRPISVRELAETVQKLVGKDVEIQHLPARAGDYRGKEVSRKKSKEVLGWEPEIDFEEGMRRTIEWYARKLGRDPAEFPALGVG